MSDSKTNLLLGLAAFVARCRLEDEWKDEEKCFWLLDVLNKLKRRNAALGADDEGNMLLMLP